MHGLKLVAAACVACVSLASTAYAGVPVQVPEPGTLSILGAAVAGLIIGGRFIRRK